MWSRSSSEIGAVAPPPHQPSHFGIHEDHSLVPLQPRGGMRGEGANPECGSSHHGETGHLTADACKKASGGVLLIDEAYALRLEGSSDSAGQECVNTLVKESEDRAGELVIILAGYHKEMTTFLNTNPGPPI